MPLPLAALEDWATLEDWAALPAAASLSASVCFLDPLVVLLFFLAGLLPASSSASLPSAGVGAYTEVGCSSQLTAPAALELASVTVTLAYSPDFFLEPELDPDDLRLPEPLRM